MMELSLEDFRAYMLSEQEKVTGTLDELKADGKEKTVRYRELFAQKLLNNAALESIEQYKRRAAER